MRILVAIPVYNEQQYVRDVVSEVRRYASDVLMIDDGSSDATPRMLAEQPVDVIRHAENRGYGRSIRDAFRWACCYGYDWLITMDCDEQHEPASLPRFYEAIEQNDADVLSGSRYLDTSDAEGAPPAERRAINQQVTRMINDRLGLALTDAFCGFKAYRVSALDKLKLSENGYALPMQFWVQAACHDLRVREVPIRLIYKDPERRFGGVLDDAQERLKHYEEVFETELAKCGEAV